MAKILFTLTAAGGAVTVSPAATSAIQIRTGDVLEFEWGDVATNQPIRVELVGTGPRLFTILPSDALGVGDRKLTLLGLPVLQNNKLIVAFKDVGPSVFSPLAQMTFTVGVGASGVPHIDPGINTQLRSREFVTFLQEQGTIQPIRAELVKGGPRVQFGVAGIPEQRLNMLPPVLDGGNILVTFGLAAGQNGPTGSAG